MKKSDYLLRSEQALKLFEKANIVLGEEEKRGIEVADFGLGISEKVGLQLVVYVNTARVCAKEMALLPHQTCPEHWHVETDGNLGKEETFRCRYGTVYLYVDGKPTEKISAVLPPTDITVFHEIILRSGEQYTLQPYTKHWFQAGEEGAVISEFSTHSTDETDCFTDKRIVRMPFTEE